MKLRSLYAGVVFVMALPLTGLVILVLCGLVILDAIEEWFE